MDTKNAIGVLRVSSTKQGLQGDSPEQQKDQIEQFAHAHNYKVVKYFTMIESASGENQPLQLAVDYCKDPNYKIQSLIVKSIDRFTRAGSYAYQNLKAQLARCGVDLVDIYGIIGGDSVNTLSHLDIEYSWSKFNLNKKSEILEAERAKDEVRDILTRMIGAEVHYVRLGYRVRPPPPGYINQKIETEIGKRVILKPDPVEAPWFIRMFELRMQGNLSDPDIVKEINLLGFRSRKIHKHDKESKLVIGYAGEKQLTVKQLQRFIQNPIYAGINNEKWMNGKPIKARFEGLVTISMFNKANHGKIAIHETSEGILITKGETPDWQKKKLKENPNFPYKQYVLCPKCHHELYGSAPRGKSRPHPAYHCSREIDGKSHWFYINKKDFDKTIQKFVSDVRFSDQFIQEFNKTILEEWNSHERNVSNDTITYNQRLIAIEQELQLLKDKIKQLSTTTAIGLIEEDIGKLQQEKILLITKRDKKEDEQLDIQLLLNYTQYYLEHLEELLLGGSDPLQNASLFGLLFEQSPTYDDLKIGTPKLACIFKLKEHYDV